MNAGEQTTRHAAARPSRQQLVVEVEPEGPLLARGVMRRTAPFIAIALITMVIAPIGAIQFDRTLYLLAWIVVGVDLLAIFATPWRRLPRPAQVAPVMLAIVAHGLLRESTGGGTTGSSLGLVIVLWIAIYEGRRALLLTVIGVALANLLPVIGDSAAVLPLELRRAVTSISVFGIVGWVVQDLVAALRRARRDAAGLAAAREAALDNLESALAREQEALEQVRELDQLKSRFVAMASHELRTPLTSISGFAITLNDRWSDLDEMQRRSFVAVIESEAARLHALVDDVLVLSRIQSSGLAAHPTQVKLRPMIVEAAATAGVDAEVHCDSDTAAWADDTHVRRMLLNYLSNARKYGTGPVVVEVELPSGGSEVEVRVVDHGPGISAEFEPRLFTEFERDEQNVDPDVPGTGLGLSIVRALATANKGSVFYRRNEPHGAVFGVRLPVASA